MCSNGRVHPRRRRLKAAVEPLCGYPGLKSCLWVDDGYRGEALKSWVAAVKKTYKIDLTVVSKQGSGFGVLPRR